MPTRSGSEFGNERIYDVNLAHDYALLRNESEELSREELVLRAANHKDVIVTPEGHLATDTEDNKGRSDGKKIVHNQRETEPPVRWGEVNKPATELEFDRLRTDIFKHLKNEDTTWASRRAIVPNPDVPQYRVEIFSEAPLGQLFMNNMLSPDEGGDVEKTITILHAPTFEADPERHGSKGKEGIFIDLATSTVLIVGTKYAGELKKAVFTILNYELPKNNILPLHASAGIAANGRVVVYAGLSGTGKSTLSASQKEKISDDETIWGPNGLINIEAGLYPKVFELDVTKEPDIHEAVKHPDVILENVELDPETNEPLYHHEDTHPNARASFPQSHINGFVEEGIGDHPDDFVMLCFDAHGVIPPISLLTPDQAYKFFLQGYTSKVAKTEKVAEGQVDTGDPIVIFSACLGEPFLPLDPRVYAGMLRDKFKKHGTRIWMINTGFIGPNNERIDLDDTKALAEAIVNGDFDDVETVESTLGLRIPVKAPNSISDELLDPANGWDNEDDFKDAQKKLEELFTANWNEKYADVEL